MADRDSSKAGDGRSDADTKLNGAATIANGNHPSNNQSKDPSNHSNGASDPTETLLKKPDHLGLEEAACPVPLEVAGSSEPTPPIPPDGGYGWAVMIASFFVNVIVDGVCFSFGIFYLEFLEYYGESKAKTSVVGSVLNGMYLTMGPIVSALANKFGCRAVSITGSLIATLAYCLSVLSPNVNVLILLYGGLGGLGFGLMYLPAIVMVGFYFEKRRALATGIAVCGSGIGAFVFAPLCEYLLSVYTWKGATMIVAGLVLNGVVCGALYRPLEAKKSPPKPTLGLTPRVRNFSEDTDDGTEHSADHSAAPPVKEVSPVASHVASHAADPKALLYAKMKDNVNRELAHDANLTKVTQQDACVQSCHNLSHQAATFTHKACVMSKSVNDLRYPCDVGEQQQQKEEQRHAKDLERPMYRQDIFYSGSIQHLPQFQQNKQDVAEYVRSTTSIPNSTPESQSPRSRSALWQCRRWCKAATDTLSTMMDFSLLKNPVFTPYGISCFLCMTGFFVPFTFLPAHALDQGCTKNQSAFLLSIIGIANTLARVMCGWVSDQSWADPILINNSALIIGGIATILCPFCYNYALLATYSAVFGACIAAFVSLRSIIMVELMGLEKLTNAFGLVTMCQGLSAFIGAPIAGALYDVTGDYTYSFYMAGGTLFAAGVICIPLRRISVWYNNKQQRSNSTTATVPVTNDNASAEKPPLLQQNVTEQGSTAVEL